MRIIGAFRKKDVIVIDISDEYLFIIDKRLYLTRFGDKCSLCRLSKDTLCIKLWCEDTDLYPYLGFITNAVFVNPDNKLRRSLSLFICKYITRISNGDS